VKKIPPMKQKSGIKEIGKNRKGGQEHQEVAKIPTASQYHILERERIDRPMAFSFM